MLPVSSCPKKPFGKMVAKQNSSIVVSQSSNSVPLSSLKPNAENITIIVRVVRSWEVCLRNRDRPVAVEMVLVDNQGTKILGRMEVAHVYKFGNLLREGSVVSISNFKVVAANGEYRPTAHECKLLLRYHSEIKQMPITEVDVPPYDFTPPDYCLHRDFDKDYLIDVMGMYIRNSEVSTFGEAPNKGSRMTVDLQSEGVPFTVTLFGDYALQMKQFADSGCASGAVIAVFFCKVNRWPGGTAIQTTQRTSRLLINPDIPEAAALRESSQALTVAPLTRPTTQRSQSDEDTFLTLEQKYTIQNVREITEIDEFVVTGTINSIVEGIPWWYWACREDYYKCTIEEDAPGLYYCPKCNMHVTAVVRKLFLKLSIYDDTDCIVVTLFDNIVKMLTGRTAEDVYQSWNQDPAKGFYPTEVTNLLGKDAIWRIVAAKKEESDSLRAYKATRASLAEDLINKYNQKWSSECAIEGQKQELLLLEDTPPSVDVGIPKVSPLGVSQEVVDEFQNSTSGSTSGIGAEAAVDLTNDADETRGPKRKVVSAATSSSKVSSKNIKLEK